MRRGGIWLAFVVVALPGALCLSASGTASAPQTGLRAAFREAAARSDVPERLLLAVGYVNTRFRMPGRPALDGGIGIMHLPRSSLSPLARQLGVRPPALRRDARANVRAGAVLLDSVRRRDGGLAAWYRPLARLGGTPYADEVYDALRSGFSVSLGHAGGTLRLGPTPVPLPRRSLASRGRADYPYARWFPASRRNYARASRPRSGPIKLIVIHVTEGSYGGSIAWFANPSARVSAHYVVRSSDGEVTQTVHDKDVAWHAGNSAVNAVSIGIEHEGYESNCRWYTDAMYRGSARLVAYLAQKYGIPLDRRHVIGHAEVPDPDGHGWGGADHHTDPGPCWKWGRYMGLVRMYAGASFSVVPQRIMDDARRSGFRAPRGWRRVKSLKGYGRSYALARPSRSGAPARFRLRVPRTGEYALYAWWPGSARRNPSVPVGIDTAAGRKWIRVDERQGSGWRYLGAFPLTGAKSVRVLFSRQTDTPGSIAADAVKLELLPVQRIGAPLSQTDGWTVTPKGLLRTRDAGTTWQDVSPPGMDAPAIRGAEMSGQSGAVVAVGGKTPLRLLRTADGGTTWRSSSLPVPRGVDVGAPVSVQVLDDDHIAVAVRLEPNRRSLDRGLLFRSSDAGVTWSGRVLPAGGEVSFSTTRDGWLVAGLAHERLYATHNGGRSWAPVRPRIPVKRSLSSAYGLPTFIDATDGVASVSVSARKRSALVFAATSNRGRSWRPARVIRLRRELGLGARVPTAVADASTWYAAVGRKLVAVRDWGVTKQTVGPLPGKVSALRFWSPAVGWADVGTCRPLKCSLRLYGTRDGGLTWTRLRLP